MGYKFKDKVTGFSGIVVSVSFDLYGCVQYFINPGLDKDGKLKDGFWFDPSRLAILPGERIMPLPNFEVGPIAEGLKGPADKKSPGH